MVILFSDTNNYNTWDIVYVYDECIIKNNINLLATLNSKAESQSLILQLLLFGTVKIDLNFFHVLLSLKFYDSSSSKINDEII